MNQTKKYRNTDYDQAQATRWLSWIAKNMQRHDQTVFLIEQLQVSWLPGKLGQTSYYLLAMIAEMFVHGFVAGALGLLIAANQACGWLVALYGFLSALVVSLIFSIGRRKKESIEMTGKLTWSWNYFRKNLKKAFLTGALRGLLAAIFFGVIMAIPGELPKSPTVNLTLAGLLIVGGGLIGAITMGLRNNVPELTTVPNEGIRRTMATGLKRGLSGGLLAWVFGILFFSLDAFSPRELFCDGGECAVAACNLGNESAIFWGLLLGLAVGLPMGSFRGVMAGIRHYMLRFVIYLRGHGPLDYADFLDYAVDELHFMRRVGGGYIFLHRMLLEHFAEMDGEEIGKEESLEVI